MTDEQKEYVKKTLDWIADVIQCQKRFMELEDLWTAYPFKTRINKELLAIIYASCLDVLQAETRNTPKGVLS